MSFKILANAADNDPMIARAFAAYYRSSATTGMFTNPSNRSYRGTAENGLEYVVLISGCNEILATYRIRPNGVLKRLRRWPVQVMVWAPRSRTITKEAADF